MAGVDFPNLPTFGLNKTTEDLRNAEYPGTPLSDVDGDGTIANPYLGMNRAASCAPGIGINTGDVEPKLDDWSVLDQDGSPRTPQFTQHIGGNGLGDGSETGDIVKVVQAADFNDSLSFIEALAQAAPGQGFGLAGADPVNRTGKTIEIGERAWGTNTL